MKSVLLLSAGLDSTVNLAKASAESEVVEAITFDYGQKAAAKEIERAGAIAKHYGVAHSVFALDFLKSFAGALTGPDPLPRLTESELNDFNKTSASAKAVWVPNRNGVFVNVGAAIAEANEADSLVAGFNAEEAVAFPDNSAEFVKATNLAFSFSTRHRVSLISYTLDLSKTEIITLGQDLNAPLELVWPCYESADIMCGTCESCVRFKRAARQAGADYLLEGRFSFDD